MSLIFGHLLGPPGKILTPVPQRQVLAVVLASRYIGVLVVNWIYSNALNHFPSMCRTAALVYGFLAIIGFAMHPTDIYLVPTVYQALHLMQWDSRMKKTHSLPWELPA